MSGRAPRYIRELPPSIGDLNGTLKDEGWGMMQTSKKLGISRASAYRALESAKLRLQAQ